MVQEVAELAQALGNNTEHVRLSALASQLMKDYNHAFFVCVYLFPPPEHTYIIIHVCDSRWARLVNLACCLQVSQ